MVERITPKIITATEASNSFGSLIDEASRGKSFFVITRMGKAKAVVLGVEQYKELLEELEAIAEQEDPQIQKALEDARQDIEIGRTISLKELDQELGFTEEELSS